MITQHEMAGTLVWRCVSFWQSMVGQLRYVLISGSHWIMSALQPNNVLIVIRHHGTRAAHILC